MLLPISGRPCPPFSTLYRKHQVLAVAPLLNHCGYGLTRPVLMLAASSVRYVPRLVPPEYCFRSPVVHVRHSPHSYRKRYLPASLWLGAWCFRFLSPGMRRRLVVAVHCAPALCRLRCATWVCPSRQVCVIDLTVALCLSPILLISTIDPCRLP